MIARSLPPTCLSDFTLDQRVCGESDGDRAVAVQEHLAGCGRCSQRLEELRRERDAFAAEPWPPAPRAVRSTPRRPPRWAVATVSVAAAIAALVLLVPRKDRDGETRTKGPHIGFRFFVDHAGKVRSGGPDERVEPGDALRFVFSTNEARYLAVLSVDGAGHASTYYPTAGTPSRGVAGVDVPLPASTVLDETLGRETIYGIACRAPFDVERLRRALEGAPDRPPAPADCDVEEIVLHKEAPRAP
jgi:hypothetical protein